MTKEQDCMGLWEDAIIINGEIRTATTIEFDVETDSWEIMGLQKERRFLTREKAKEYALKKGIGILATKD